jgi:hypothetical protein
MWVSLWTAYGQNVYGGSTHMHLQPRIFDDRWFRFERYDITEGYIRPGLNAKLIECAPWREFGEAEGKLPRQQPYHSLLELIARLGSRSELTKELRDGNLSLERRSAIAEWCARHGLLGILLHVTESVTLPAELLPTGAFPIAPLPLLSQEVPSSVRYVRTSRGWTVQGPTFTFGGDAPPAGVIARSLTGFELNFEPLSFWDKFFPEPASRYPVPFTEEFWRAYAEPLDAFVVAACTFADAIEALRSRKPRVGRGMDAARRRLVEQKRWTDAETTMHALTCGARVLLYRDRRGALAIGWACSSLLGSLAMMATLDLAHSRVAVCANEKCRNFFTTKSSMGLYCSKRCRGAVQIRRHRRNLLKGER